MSDLLHEARLETTRECSAAMLKAAREALLNFGDDPMSMVTFTAAVSLMISAVDGQYPGFRARMRDMLE
jgi:hypothetical protein